jgi:hypothetical protein
MISNRSYRDEPGNLMGEPELREMYRENRAQVESIPIAS